MAEVRATVLRVARGLFAQYGFKKTAMDEVASLAHVGKGTVYQHFESKEALFAAVVRSESEALIQSLSLAMKRAPDPQTKIRVFVQQRMAHLRGLANLHRLSDDTLGELVPLADEARKDYLDREAQLLTDALTEGNDAGVFRVDRPRLVALTLLSCLKGMELLLLRMREPPEFEEGIEEAMTVFFRGLAAAPQPTPLTP